MQNVATSDNNPIIHPVRCRTQIIPVAHCRTHATPVATLAGVASVGFTDTFNTCHDRYLGAVVAPLYSDNIDIHRCGHSVFEDCSCPLEMLQLQDLTAAAMDNLDPAISQFAGKFSACEDVRATAREMGYDTDGTYIWFDSGLNTYTVDIRCTEEQLADIVEAALGVV